MSTKQWPLIINLGNSIIGVSVLAMPFCFSQCGILLGIVLLLSAAWLTSISCTLLMKSALVTKRRSFEFLALHSYGGFGKLAVEVTSIGLLIGTCIAFYVVIGDLGPGIIGKVLNVENTSTLRTALLLVVAAVVVTPLGLLRDVESLNNISTASICFYIVLVSTVVLRAMPNIISGVWINKVVFWNPEGIFKCLPIFAMAFGCQTQLFLMYNALSEPSLNQIVTIVKGAVSLCTGVYLSMGFFGYVAYCDSKIAGDVLMNFAPSALADMLKMGFVLSVAVSFPLVIFPCRASIQTLLFAPRTLHDNTIGGGFMRVREMHFRSITMMIIISTLCVGIAVPQIEFILGLTGSTMGSVICFVFPALIFLKVSPISTDNSRAFAKLVLILGITILFVSTYTTIHNHHQEDSGPIVPIKKDVEIAKADIPKDKPVVKVEEKPEVDEKSEDKRQEPPIPQPPEDEKVKEEKSKPADEKPKSIEKPANISKNDTLSKNGKNKSSEQGNVAKALNQTVEKTKKEMNENLNKQKKILEELQEQQKEQKEILKEQKKLLAELKEHDKSHKNVTVKTGQTKQGGAQPIAGQQGGAQPVAGQQGGAQPIVQQQGGAQPVAQQQGGAQPVAQQQGGAQPVAQQHGGAQPVAQQQAGAQPVAQQQGAAQPVAQQQGGAQPVAQQQGGAQPVAGGAQPFAQQQGVAQLVGQQQGGAQPVAQQQVGAQPIAQQQGGAQPVAQQQGGAQPVAQQQGGAQPIAKQQGNAQPVAQQQGGAQPVAQQQGGAQPVAQQQGNAQPVAQQQGGAQPVAQQQGGAQPVAQQQGNAQPVAQQQAGAQQGGVQPVAQQQVGAQPVAKQQVPAAKQQVPVAQKQGDAHVAENIPQKVEGQQVAVNEKPADQAGRHVLKKRSIPDETMNQSQDDGVAVGNVNDNALKENVSKEKPNILSGNKIADSLDLGIDNHEKVDTQRDLKNVESDIFVAKNKKR